MLWFIANFVTSHLEMLSKVSIQVSALYTQVQYMIRIFCDNNKSTVPTNKTITTTKLDKTREEQQ